MAKVLVKMIIAVTSLACLFALALITPNHAKADTSHTTCLQPPSNIDHATFTDAQLDAYGLPHRHAGETLVDWQEVVRHAQHRFCTSISLNKWHTAPTKSTQVEAGLRTTTNWSGYEVADTFNYSVNEAYGKWNIPCLTLRLTWGVSSQWVGLGGDTVYNGSSARNLIQTGTEADEVSNFPGHWYESTYAWYERVPLEPVQQIQNFTTSCGDSMYADVWQDTYGGHMYLADNTRNEYYQKDTTTNLTNGSSGEWIVERTYTSDSKPLDNFNYVVFTNCVAHENGYGTGGISSFINYDVVLLNSKGQALSNPTGLQQDSGDIGSNFRVNYVTGVSNP